jgi:hypothetical protein
LSYRSGLKARGYKRGTLRPGRFHRPGLRIFRARRAHDAVRLPKIAAAAPPSSGHLARAPPPASTSLERRRPRATPRPSAAARAPHLARAPPPAATSPSAATLPSCPPHRHLAAVPTSPPPRRHCHRHPT